MSSVVKLSRFQISHSNLEFVSNFGIRASGVACTPVLSGNSRSNSSSLNNFRYYPVFDNRMRTRNLAPVLLSLMLALTSCSKHSASTSQRTQTDLGVVQVSTGQTTRHDLGNGETCTITPTVFTNGTILLEMKVKRDGNLISRPRIQTTSGIAVAFTSGEVDFALTPVVKP